MSSDTLAGNAIPTAPQPVVHAGVICKEKSSNASHSGGSVSSSISIAEKGGDVSIGKDHDSIWEGYQDDVLPDKMHGHYIRNLRHHILNIYRRLFGVVFVTNMGIFIATAAKGSFTAQYLGLIVIANIFTAVLIRQEYVVNILFFIFCSVPPSWPLFIRRLAARIYSLGGVHSGCAVSGVVWLVLFAAEATSEVINGGKCSVPTLVITYCVLVLLLVIVAFAYPYIRLIAHDKFERTHRLLGWTAVALVWCLVILLTNDYREPGQKLGAALTNSPAFWLVVILTISIILPWLYLRKYPVRSEVLSDHAVRLHFDYGVTPVPGSFTRISDSPLLEWHSFATIAEPDKKGKYSMVISRAGDWTSKQIENPPSAVWIRGIPTCGVMRVAPMFRRVVLVATGSGIAPIAPHVLAACMPIRLLWVSPNIRQTFGDKLVDEVITASPDAVIYDTRKYGRPDMVKLSYRLYREFDAEAVFIISNQRLTQKVVYGLMSRGIPAFGAIWDS
ncbi:hypothetical protein M0805_006934 [Coniferiporia weirii]|nr:hypothetical protein M0805_006934 [Coniferiporia weirii]